MTREDFLYNYIKDACKSSSIYYDGEYPSIKLIDKTGEILYVDKSRMLDIIHEYIPGWDYTKDLKTIMTFNDDKSFKICESHKYNGNYCTSIMYLANKEK